VQLVMFSKMLGVYPIERAGEVIKGLGFDGVDLTVRPGGHVLPEEVAQKLPEAVRILKGLGLAVPMITTGIATPADACAEDIFRTAAQCGIAHLKLGYWRYAGFGQLRRQIAEIQRHLDGIEALARRYGVWAGIHNHSGSFVSALPVVVAELLKDRDPRAVGAYFDPGHATAEGGVAGWKMGLDLLAERIRLVAVKSFGWFPEKGPTGETVWHEKLVPLSDGTVRWPEVFALLRQTGFDGVVSVHSEYQGSHSWRDLTTEQLIEQTRQDVAYLRSAMG